MILLRFSIIIFDMSEKENVRKIRTVASFLKRTFQLLMVYLLIVRMNKKEQSCSGQSMELAFMSSMRIGSLKKSYPNISNTAIIHPLFDR